MADDNTTSYKTPFGKEVDFRAGHLDRLPGKTCHEWFESMNRASKVFSGNSTELEKHFTQFVGTTLFVTELDDGFGDEAARLLHNYLAGLSTLRDVLRGVHRRVWPDRYAPGTDDKRTKWEVEVWTPRIEELLGDDSIVFLVGLRNYSLHYGISMLSPATNFAAVTGQPGGPMAFSNTIALDRAQLLKWDGWTAPARRYIDSQTGDSVDIVSVVELYSKRVREWYGWFWEQVENEVRVEVDEYRRKSTEYGHWLNVETTVSRFGFDGPAALRRPLAEARLQRAQFGTSGWRVISLNESGEWVVGETDWPPLPAGPR